MYEIVNKKRKLISRDLLRIFFNKNWLEIDCIFLSNLCRFFGLDDY